ncbi:MAG TPA: methyltransferase domain-containing protein [Gaiellaceae bacterium]|nr:methyltransferase domain-containing protein [Gaiellaceae bacterium]
METNRALWDELTAVHAASAFYDLDGFKAGRSTIRPLERAEVGDVSGKRLLHLQCHFGMDTLSWARLGAQVVGVDFSAKAITLARSLSAELGIPAEFVCSDVYELSDNLEGQFDVVFTSHGVLLWLPDLKRWAQVIDHFLAPGGLFYIAESHPVLNAVSEREGELVLDAGHFRACACTYVSDGSYADREAVLVNKTSHEWQHPLAEVVTALADVGLRIEFLHEYPFSVSKRLPSMQQGDDCYWRLPDSDALPLLFTIRAHKPAP